jgi:hypothetical protein
MLTAIGCLALLAGASAQARPVPGCAATVVHRTPNRGIGSLSGSRWIRLRSSTPGVFGVLFGGEVVGGRLALYAGGKNPFTGGNEKILWLVPRRARIGSDTRLVGRRLDSSGSFVEHLGEAGAGSTPGRDFPSIVDVPKAGCWRLTLRSGGLSAAAVALVRKPVR